MTDIASRILGSLAAVDAERRTRLASPTLAREVAALKTWQQARFARTHADLMTHRRYGRAANFFLDELYGPQDFTRRDAQFGRIVPAIVRLFPDDIVRTVECLVAVHALSETLDTAVARHLGGAPPTRASYVRAWQAAGDQAGRARQIELVMRIGVALDRHVRSFVLRASLKAMRGPARAAGLGALQAFLENGFDAFHAMGGAREFLHWVETRETTLAGRLFDTSAIEAAEAPLAAGDVLAQLPSNADFPCTGARCGA